MGVFFIKQAAAYEMRISDWSSDVCSSDLGPEGLGQRGGEVEIDHRALLARGRQVGEARTLRAGQRRVVVLDQPLDRRRHDVEEGCRVDAHPEDQDGIGREWCEDRGGQYV